MANHSFHRSYNRPPARKRPAGCRFGSLLHLVLGLVWLVVSPGPRSTAADTAALQARYSLDAWQVQDGLPGNTVTSITQTPDGYLWFGTFQGLVRFDGVRFTVFDSTTPGLESERVTRLFVDRSGALWVCMEFGQLSRYAAGKFTPMTKADGWPGLPVRWIANSPTGTLLVTVGVDDFGPRLLFEYQQGHFTERLSGPVIPPEVARTRTALGDTVVEVDSTGRQWVVQDKRLGYLEGSKWTPWKPSEGEPPKSIFRIANSPRGGLWVCADGKIRRLEGGEWKRDSPTYAWPTNSAVMDLIEDSSGQIWAGSWGFGLLRAQPDGTETWFTTENGFPSNIVGSIFEDRERNLWIGTTAGGLLRLRDREFLAYDQMQGLPAGSIAALAKEPSGVCWVGMTAAGLWRLPKQGRAEEIPLSADATSATIRTLLVDRNGGVWAGLHGNSLFRYQNGQLKRFSRGQGMLHEVLHTLFEARDGTLWIGGDKGLSRFDGQTFQTWTTRDGLASDLVTAITQDQAGNLWLGTIGGGLSVFRDGKFRTYGRSDGLAHDSIRALLADVDGTLWIGTAGGGLNRLRDGHFTSYSVKDGLPGNAIASVTDDGLGNLWCSSNRGVFRVARKDLEHYNPGLSTRLEVITYGANDGLASIEAAPGNPTALRDSEGKLWFATIRHISVVNPREIRPNEVAPAAVVEEVLIDGKPRFSNADASPASHVSLAGGFLEVPAGNQRLEIRYTGLSLKASERVHFRHRLVGVEDRWEEAGTRRTATYHTLTPGPYRFEILAANSDGVWGTQATTLDFKVLPAWWQTGWFRGTVALALYLAGWAAYRARIRALTRERIMQEDFSRRLIASQEAERQRIAHELHDSLGQNLLVIKSRVAMAQLQPGLSEKLSEQLTEAATMASGAIREVREISQNLRPFQLDELGLTKALSSMVRKLAAASPIQFHSDIAEVRDLLSSEAEINLYRIVQECLNNVIRHSQATECSVVVTAEPGLLRVTVVDNGRGIGDGISTDGGGFGLRGIRERVRTFGGTVNFLSRPGEGTRVVVVVPLPT